MNSLKNTAKILDQIIVPKSQHLIAFRLEPFGSQLIASSVGLFAMLRAV